MVRKRFNEKAQWFPKVLEVLEKLESGESNLLPKIPSHQFQRAGSTAQKQMLRSKLEDVLRLAGVPLNQHLTCFAHSPDSHPSMIYNVHKQGFECPACIGYGKQKDIFDIIGIYLGTDNFNEKMKFAKSMFLGEPSDVQYPYRVQTQATQSKQIPVLPASYEQSIASATGKFRYPDFDKDPECVEFLVGRGISIETAKRLELKHWVHPTSRNKYVVIHCDKKFSVRRMYKHITGDYKEHKFSYPKNDENDPDKKVKLFNGRRLATSKEGEFILVVESALDAILLEQLGYAAVSINGAGNHDLILEKADAIRKKKLHLILLLDNDPSHVGRNHAIIIHKAFSRKGIPTIIHWYDKLGIAPYLASFKDIGEAYVNDSERTMNALRELIDSIKHPAVFSLTDEEESKLLPSQKGYNPLLQFGIAKKIDKS